MTEVIDIIKKQQTTRRGEFRDKRIPDKIIDSIKESILSTPNASNRQSYSIVVLDKEKTRKLSLPGERVFIFCVDFNRLNRCSEMLGCDFDSSYFMQYNTALIDISLLAQSAILAAQSLGLGTLLTNEIYHKKVESTFKELKIPKRDVFPVIAVSMGYKKLCKKQKSRLDGKYIFHDNEYKDFTESDIKDIVSDTNNKDNIGLISNWKEKGYNTYYNWFFQKWSKAVGTKSESDSFLTNLKEHNIIHQNENI